MNKTPAFYYHGYGNLCFYDHNQLNYNQLSEGVENGKKPVGTDRVKDTP